MKAIEKYTETINYYNQVNYKNQMNFIWENNMSDISRIVNESKTEEELIDKVDRTFMYSINFPPENACHNGQDSGCWTLDQDTVGIRDKQIDWLLSKLRFDLNSMPENIQESKFINEKNKTIRNNRVLSGNFLRTLSISQQVFKYCSKDIKTIFELGAGAGHQARTFMLQLPDVKYTIIDLPETMIFSFTYLSLNFPEKKLFWVTTHEDLKYIDDYDIVFIPAMFSDDIHGRSYDLFHNCASAGEMRNDVIQKWMDFIQNKMNFKYLHTFNRYCNVVDHWQAPTRRNENQCSVLYDENWKILNWELEPIFARCPYIDTLHSRYLEIIAKREKFEDDLVTESNKWLNDAKSEDIFRLSGKFSNGLMQQRLNWFNNNTTMTGTLFKLWNSIRFNKNKENVQAMMTYMKSVTVSHTFEEYYYYESLLSSL